VKRALFIVALAVVLAVGTAVGRTEESPAAAEAGPVPGLQENRDAAAFAKTGTALLDMFIDNMRGLAQKGTSEAVDRRLQEMMVAATKAREAKTIDLVFFSRFRRLLAITKLVATPDATGILGPFIDRVLDDFVQQELGHPGFREEGGKGPKAINYVATALSEEIINLQIYLDTLSLRQKIQDKIEERMSTPVKD
jgi:hypothetical protein